METRGKVFEIIRSGQNACVFKMSAPASTAKSTRDRIFSMLPKWAVPASAIMMGRCVRPTSKSPTLNELLNIFIVRFQKILCVADSQHI